MARWQHVCAAKQRYVSLGSQVGMCCEIVTTILFSGDWDA
jgi:hypothetical protein